MNILKRIKFAINHDIKYEYIVYSFKEQNTYRFLDYKDAKEFSDNQIMYKPQVLVEVKGKITPHNLQSIKSEIER